MAKRKTVLDLDVVQADDGYSYWNLFGGRWRWKPGVAMTVEAAGITGVWSAVWHARTLGEAVAYSWGWTQAMKMMDRTGDVIE